MVEKKINGIKFSAGRWPLVADRPTVLFIHGSGNSRAFWNAQVEGLAETANTVALDLPGHGGSDGPRLDSVSAYAVAVAGFIDAIEAPAPVPSGLSMGGAIALQLLLDGKRDYRAGILINTGARLRVAPMILELIKSDYSSYVESLPAVAASPKTDPSLLKGLMDEAAKCDPDTAYGDFMACNTFDVMARLGEICVPVLVLTAEDDRLSPPKYGQYLKEHIANSRLAHIADAGHMSPVEKANEVNGTIAEFLASI
jgi:pimeloyl-ACP methyl ester carboxylesterase